MSISLMAEAWRLNIPSTEKMVLLCLCDFANDRGECWPSVDTLAGKCSLSDRTVQKAIKQLREWGMVSTVDAPGRPHTFTVNPRSSFTPENTSPPKMTAKPPKDIHPRGEAASPKPSYNHQEPSDHCSSVDERLKPEEVFEAWNEMAGSIGKPKVRDFTPERRQAVKSRLSQFTLDDFATVFANIRSSQFLRDWRGCCFDWVMKKANFLKILEGNYNG